MTTSKFMQIMDAQTGIASAQIDYIREEVIAKKKMQAACESFKKTLDDIKEEWENKALDLFVAKFPDKIVDWTELDCEGIIVEYYNNNYEEVTTKHLIKWEEME